MAWCYYSFGLLCLVWWLHSAYSSDCSRPLGMESHKIPRKAITASSESNFWHRASKARLSSRPYYRYTYTWMCPGWSPSAYDVKPWLQIYLGYPHVITGVATQGGRARRAWSWVTVYKISYSMDGRTWKFYRSANGTTKIFTGNTNSNQVVTNVIKPPLTAIYVRIHPVTWTGVISLRVELYGCVDVDECRSSPCKNGATCNNLVQGYTCTCRAGYFGKNCEINIGICATLSKNPCLHGGSCFDQINDYSCRCLPGFVGKHCEKDIDECESKPCRNGATCIDMINDYRCTCRPGYTGKMCQIDLGPDCTCMNGATCTDAINGRGFTCKCRPGFTGKNCEQNIDDCELNSCMNGGTCSDLVNNYRCSCRPGTTGKRCEINLGPHCTCMNGATCTDAINDRGFRCKCHQGFTGKDCEQNIDECESSPCRNGATCIDMVNEYRCACRPGYTGKICEIVIGSHCTCVNGATCTETVDGFRCKCLPGFTGKYCEKVMGR